jgi:hypothetical protein
MEFSTRCLIRCSIRKWSCCKTWQGKEIKQSSLTVTRVTTRKHLWGYSINSQSGNGSASELSNSCINHLKPSGFFYVPPALTFKNSTRFSLCIEGFVRISEQTATFALYIINWLLFITVAESVYSAVRSDCLYKADHVSSLKGSTIYDTRI